MSLLGTPYGDRLGLEANFDVNMLSQIRDEDISIVEESEESLIHRRQFDFPSTALLSDSPHVILLTGGPILDTQGIRAALRGGDPFNPATPRDPQAGLKWWNDPLPQSRKVEVVLKT